MFFMQASPKQKAQLVVAYHSNETGQNTVLLTLGKTLVVHFVLCVHTANAFSLL